MAAEEQKNCLRHRLPSRLSFLAPLSARQVQSRLEEIGQAMSQEIAAEEADMDREFEERMKKGKVRGRVVEWGETVSELASPSNAY